MPHFISNVFGCWVPSSLAQSQGTKEGSLQVKHGNKWEYGKKYETNGRNSNKHDGMMVLQLKSVCESASCLHGLYVYIYIHIMLENVV